MKFITLLAGLMFSANAFAAVNLTWSEIQASSKYSVDAPGAWYINSNPKALGTTFKRFISLTGKPQACVAGDMIYGGTVKSCVKVQSTSGGDDRCVATETTQLWAPISGTKTICVEENDSGSNCRKTKTLSYTIDTNVTAKIVELNGSAAGQRVVGTKQMQLPACATAPRPPSAN